MKQNKKRIVIVVLEETAGKCIGKGCMRAFNTRTDSFAHYQGQELELVGFCHDGGPSDDPLVNLKKTNRKFQKKQRRYCASFYLHQSQKPTLSEND